MNDLLMQYCQNIEKRFKSNISTEHSYRGDLQDLLQSLTKGIEVTNEPKRQKCGAPDFILQKKEVPICYIETKDINIDLDKIEKSEQIKRYSNSLDKLILTNYLEFRFINCSKKVSEIKIAEVKNNKFNILSNNFESLINYIKDFCELKGQPIKSSEKLAKIMASKTRLMEDVFYKALTTEDEDITLKDQFAAFKKYLIHDLNEKSFADMYAQTIAYGLFAARLYDTTIEDFSREEAVSLIPRSNPFLRSLFNYVAGIDLDSRVKWIVNDLAYVFSATNVKTLLYDFVKSSGKQDPFLHFYETFLSAYDAKLRKSRGVYYTPEPVVNFIVRAVDDILKDEFNLKEGLADTTKIEIKTEEQGVGKIKKQIHKVQILDPATGTGTFLCEVIKQIHKKFENQEGIWSSYVENELIPRLNGFEILMSPYTMCYLKLEMVLRATGYEPKNEKKQKRLRVFLANALEEAHPDTGTVFAFNLSNEAKEANLIKKETPVMVVLGNPPYSISSSNKNKWIDVLIKNYKKDLNEKKLNLDDDYIKFIRYGEYFIEKNEKGILAYISNNSFIDGITHRQIRKHLLETFNKIYILDLHGSGKKNEIAPDGTKDENVFDIQQGVSINILIKTNNSKKYAEVHHFDLYGLREIKYEALFNNSINSLKWTKLNYKEPYFFFVPKDLTLSNSYKEYCSIYELFLDVNNGIKTDRDSLFIDFSSKKLESRMTALLSGDISPTFIDTYRVKDSGSYKITQKINGKKYDSKFVKQIQYRPFDNRFIYYDPKIISRSAKKVMPNILKGSIALLSCRQQSTFDFQHILVTNILSEVCTVSLQTKETSYAFPLYRYAETNGQKKIEGLTERTPNLNQEIVKKIAGRIGLSFTNEKEDKNNTFAPIDILNYIYAVLHSPTYRKKYKEFLKIDFPRVPYPKDKQIFLKLVKLGEKLRKIHLLECKAVENYITSYPIDGNNLITRKITKKDYEIINKKNSLGRIWINDKQYFDKVPIVAWEFYIGGYQPAQKWLKDRTGRILNYEDILHYQKIVVALTETSKIMKEIDLIDFEQK